MHLVDLVVVMLRDELLVQKLSIVVDQVGRKVVRSMDEALQSRRQGRSGRIMPIDGVVKELALSDQLLLLRGLGCLVSLDLLLLSTVLAASWVAV